MKAVTAGALLATLLISGTAQAQAWWKRHDDRFTDARGKQVAVSAITVDLRKSRLQLVAPALELAPARKDDQSHSVRTFAKALASAPRYRNAEWIVANAGFSSHRVDIPVGLFIAGDRLLSTLSREKSRSPASSPDLGDLRWSGVLCQFGSDGRWDIIPATKYKDGHCRQAVQSGPMLVGPDGQIGISEDEPQRTDPYQRLVVCMRGANSITVVVTLDKTHLLPLAGWLVRPGGPGCRVALNLSGDSSAGVAIRSPGSAPVLFLGSGTYPIPTALLFERDR